LLEPASEKAPHQRDSHRNHCADAQVLHRTKLGLLNRTWPGRARVLGFRLCRLQLRFEIFAGAHRDDVRFDLDMASLRIGQVFVGA